MKYSEKPLIVTFPFLMVRNLMKYFKILALDGWLVVPTTKLLISANKTKPTSTLGRGEKAGLGRRRGEKRGRERVQIACHKA